MSSSRFSIQEHTIDASYMRQYPRGASSDSSPLQLAIKKYTPIENPNPQPGDVTLIGAHGCGFPKELYEPLWEELLARTKTSGFRIRAIWIADCVNQGESGILNEGHLGNGPSWFDHSRDLLIMINHFRDEMPQPIMGIGHSIGGAQLMHLSLLHPRILRSLLLIEPYLFNKKDPSGPELMITMATRKDIWQDRTTVRQKPGYMSKIWDPRAMEKWIEYGYRDLPTLLYPESKTPGAVTLATPKNQELLMCFRDNLKQHQQLGLSKSLQTKNNDLVPPHDPLFYPDITGQLQENHFFYRSEPMITWQMLRHYRPSALFLGAGKSALCSTGIIEQAAKLMGTGNSGSGGMPYGRVKYAVIPKAFHTLPFEKVAQTADELAPWIANEVKHWEHDEQRIAEEWEGLSPREKTMPSKTWQSAFMPNIQEYLARQKLAKL